MFSLMDEKVIHIFIYLTFSSCNQTGGQTSHTCVFAHHGLNRMTVCSSLVTWLEGRYVCLYGCMYVYAIIFQYQVVYVIVYNHLFVCLLCFMCLFVRNCWHDNPPKKTTKKDKHTHTHTNKTLHVFQMDD